MQGRVGRPGMVVIDPTNGNKNPAPTDALTSRIGRMNPVGAPLRDGSELKEYWVLAMQMGKLLKPWRLYRSMAVLVSML
jgi:hypothetical protein